MCEMLKIAYIQTVYINLYILHFSVLGMGVLSFICHNTSMCHQMCSEWCLMVGDLEIQETIIPMVTSWSKLQKIKYQLH